MAAIDSMTPIARALSFSFNELRFQNALFTYRTTKKPLFENLNLDLPLGRNIWITGSAGAGQSTLLKLMTCVTPLTSGAFFMNGEDAAQMSFEEFLPFRLKIGYTFDYGGLFSNRSLLENLALPLVYHKVCSPAQAESQIRKLADRFHFTSHLPERPALVSGGLRKLTCILRSTLLRPEMLVMDDPFTAIDSDACRTLLSLIEESRARGELRHLFLTSREASWVEKLRPELLRIEHGFIAHERMDSEARAV